MKLTSTFDPKDIQQWLGEEAKAKEKKGTLLEQLYMAQIEKSQVPSLAAVAAGMEEKFEKEQLSAAKTAAVSWLLRGLELEKLQ